MDRRTFLLHSGRWLAVAGLVPLVPVVSGCGSEVTTSTLDTGSTGAGSATTAGATATTVGAGTTTSTVGSAVGGSTGSTTSSTAPAPAPRVRRSAANAPDLAVVKGEVVEKNLRAAIALLGGMERFVKKGGKVVVKPNVLTGRPPEYATTTSPELMTAVITMCWEAGAEEVVVLDNPTSNHRCRLRDLGARPGDLRRRRQAGLPQRPQLRQGTTSPRARCSRRGPSSPTRSTADTLINLALPKQHGTSGATMTMKNLMGIMGGRRGTIHGNFSQKIVDVNTLVKPTLAILDAYRVLFRNGPTGGLAGRRPPGEDPGGRHQPGVDRRLRHPVLRQDRRPTSSGWWRPTSGAWARST